MNNIMSKKINMPYYLTSMAKDLLNKVRTHTIFSIPLF